MIRVVRGDLAAMEVECVLRPARSDGASFSGVGRRLEAGAGDAVLQRLTSSGEAPLGTALLTPGGDLPAQFLIHVVLQSPDEPVTARALKLGLLNALRRASDFGIESVALPPLGMMAGALEGEEVAEVVASVLHDHLCEGLPPRSFVIVVESAYEESVFAHAVEAMGSGRPVQ